MTTIDAVTGSIDTVTTIDGVDYNFSTRLATDAGNAGGMITTADGVSAFILFDGATKRATVTYQDSTGTDVSQTFKVGGAPTVSYDLSNTLSYRLTSNNLLVLTETSTDG